MSRFNIRINDGPERYFTVKTGVYQQAAAAIPALLEITPPFDVEIWCERLFPEYGPYHYRVLNENGQLVVQHIIPAS